VLDGLANNYIVLFDELQGAERTDMNALKKQITTVDNSYRKLHTHIVLTVPQRCSFIGATNKPLAENLSDSTGMRRFWEINALQKLDWDSIGAIDYVELWQGIDESKERGYLVENMLEQVLTKQADMVNHDDLDVFLTEMLVKPEGEDGLEIAANKLYSCYVIWASNQGIHSKLNAIWFGRKLSRKLKKSVRKENSGVTQVYYSIGSNSLAHDFSPNMLKVAQ
jgi:hypothetical protein